MARSRDDFSNALAKCAESGWSGAHVLPRIHALNERCFSLLGQLAQRDRQPIDLAIVDQHRSMLRSLSLVARQRAAQTPFLLLDMHFEDAEWWRWARDARPSRRNKLTPQAAFTGKVAGELMRETLMLAWSTVAFERSRAGLLFGMTPTVCGIVGDLAPQDIERIAARHSAHLQPRWSDFPAYWGRLLLAARDGNDDALLAIRLHGVQLIGGELLPLLDGRFA